MATTLKHTSPGARKPPIIDCDIHNELDSERDLYPYLPGRWLEHIKTYGTRGPSGAFYPRFTNRRADAFPPSGRGAGCDCDFTRRQLLDEWRRRGVLRADRRPAYYLSETEYAHADQTVRRRDVLAAVAVEQWSADVVLPHEHTMAGPQADRLELLSATHLNSSPIWLLHRHRVATLDERKAGSASPAPSSPCAGRGRDGRAGRRWGPARR